MMLQNRDCSIKERERELLRVGIIDGLLIRFYLSRRVQLHAMLQRERGRGDSIISAKYHHLVSHGV